VALADVPQEPLPERERSLCDRCGTQIAGLIGHCSSCEWDCCSSCVSQLRLHTLQQQQQGASAGSNDAAEQQQPQRQVHVTCCNPACPSVPSSRRSSSSSGGSKRKDSQSQQQQQQQQLLESVVERGQLWSVGGAAELALQVVLPPDLLTQLGRLQQLAQVWCAAALLIAYCMLGAGPARQLMQVQLSFLSVLRLIAEVANGLK
jgi:hypothetical protein